MRDEQVILVDEQDREVGRAEKMDAHRRGLRHRAVSVFLFNSRGDMLLQRRAESKYHSPGLWSNACCSHPRPAESADAAAHRRLREELGIDATLRHALTFTYREPVTDELTEHEVDHVYVGTSDATPAPDPSEVDRCRWVAVSELLRDLRDRPAAYTVWFRIVLERVLAAAAPIPGTP
jgi:isopentenyl-diphosphate delta-isomerase